MQEFQESGALIQTTVVGLLLRGQNVGNSRDPMYKPGMQPCSSRLAPFAAAVVQGFRQMSTVHTMDSRAMFMM